MQQDSLIRRQELFVAAAVIGAHANSSGEGFRQRDVRFLIDLFLNWVELSLSAHASLVQNTQVQRYIDRLVKEGFARRISRAKHPSYRLTRVGLIELLARIRARNWSEREHFFFLYFFVRCYGPRIAELIQLEGSQFPAALKIEVEALIDARTLVKREMADAERDLAQLESRIKDALMTADLVSTRKKRALSLEDAVLEAERLYPYELNSQKPLRELIGWIPQAYREWELTEGNTRRAEDIWRAQRSIQLQYLEQLKRLR